MTCVNIIIRKIDKAIEEKREAEEDEESERSRKGRNGEVSALSCY